MFQFLWVWNDLQVALIYVGGTPEVAPLTVTLTNLVGSLGQHREYLTAAALVSMVVPLRVFFTLQRYFVRGILAGSGSALALAGACVLVLATVTARDAAGPRERARPGCRWRRLQVRRRRPAAATPRRA